MYAYDVRNVYDHLLGAESALILGLQKFSFGADVFFHYYPQSCSVSWALPFHFLLPLNRILQHLVGEAKSLVPIGHESICTFHLARIFFVIVIRFLILLTF